MIGVGRLLQQARKLNTTLTQEEAAKAAGYRSKTWWAQIESGIRYPPPETVARMARVVGVTPDQLRKIGQDDAAAELADLLDLFGPYAGDREDLELLAKIKELREDQREALFVLLRLSPVLVIVLISTVPAVAKSLVNVCTLLSVG